MTSEAPDPRTFKTWEDAFQHPIPVVRKLEQQLRSNAGDNREKLRSLVGASYRDLLTTAETIIDMEVRMSSVETKLSRVGHDCNSRNINRIARNAQSLRFHQRARHEDRYTFASQLAVLRSCPTVISRLMDQDGSLLLVAKVMVIGRELYKALNQGDGNNKPPIIDSIRDKVGILRTRLLRRIDKRLASATVDVSVLVESMCAFSLATNSTPTDVLRHFHGVRMEAIARELRHADGLKEHGIVALKLCLQTCQDTQTLFPRRLADALAKLKAQPLIQDADVRALYELNLEVHERWIGDEVRNYTPWPRHDELQRSGAEKILHLWSKEAISGFIKGTKAALEKTKDLKEVATLRQELIEMWIVSGSRMAGVKSKNVLDDLRDTMNNHLGSIVRNRSHMLQDVVHIVSGHLTSWSSTDPISNLSLWTVAQADTDLSNGAQGYKTTIINTHQGRDNTIIHVLATYDRWMESILEVKRIVKSMKETRWDDPFTDDVDIDDSDDEFGDAKQTLLSEDDPRALEDSARDALISALADLGTRLGKIVQEVTGEHDQTLAVNKSTFLLRIVREISDRLPRLRINDRSTALQSPFSSDILIPLQSTIAKQIVNPTTTAYSTSLGTSLQVSTKTHFLWEGSPPLPVQPSTSAVRYLRNLTKEMGNLGSDLWAPEGVRVLKALAHEELLTTWKASLAAAQHSEQVSDSQPVGDNDDSAESPPAGGAAKTAGGNEESQEHRQRRLTQLLFDVLYIERFLTPTTSADVASSSYAEDLASSCGCDSAAQTRLRDRAADYARRTYLLFALLA